MKLHLTVWQRYALSQQVGRLRGNAGIMRQAMKLLDLVELSAKEKKAVGYAETPGGARWQDAEARFPIEIADPGIVTMAKREAENLARSIEREERWTVPIFREMGDLCEQLGLIDMDKIIETVAREKREAAERKAAKQEKEAEKEKPE